jgi:hypothetical protein
MKSFRIKFILLCLNVCLVTSCADYLDIVPDSLVTVEDAFSSRSNAEKFYNTCYGYLPSIVRPFHDPSWIASRGDEFWFFPSDRNYPYNHGDDGDIMGLRVFYGYQNTNRPYINYWDGDRSGIPLFRAIRECNIFLENVEEKNVVPDLNEWERTWWIGEVKFLKAYYHFYLMHLYGPVPIIRRNPDMNASPEELRVFREPIDDVTNYVVELLDEAAEYLDAVESDLYTQYYSWEYGGRITTSIAKAVKAKVLIWAASRLFNGNDFYTGFSDSRGKQLIPAGAPDLDKWVRAATACKEAIVWATEKGGHALLTKSNSNEIGRHGSVSSDTELKYILRYAVTEPFNREIIWASMHPTSGFGGWGTGEQNLWQMHTAREAVPTFHPMASGQHSGSIGTTLKMAEQFYTDKGLPIEDDQDWQNRIGGYEARYNTRLAGGDNYHQAYIKPGMTTAQLNFYREPRFYAYIGFDGGIWEGLGQSEENSYVVNKSLSTMTENIHTGYYMKKVVHPQSTFTPSGGSYSINNNPYTFPFIRLADLYLLYAEALTESVAGNGAPPEEAFTHVNAVRTRAGLLDVKTTWDQAASKRKGLYNSKEGMLEIIRRERTIELCFEGKRGEDMRRWRIAHEQYNSPIRGWNGISPYNNVSPGALTNAGYYLVTDHHVHSVSYGVKDYLWPIKADNLDVNSNLKQNPYW